MVMVHSINIKITETVANFPMFSLFLGLMSSNGHLKYDRPSPSLQCKCTFILNLSGCGLVLVAVALITFTTGNRPCQQILSQHSAILTVRRHVTIQLLLRTTATPVTVVTLAEISRQIAFLVHIRVYYLLKRPLTDRRTKAL